MPARRDRGRKPALYFDKMKAARPNDAVEDPVLARRLWDVSEKLTRARIDF